MAQDPIDEFIALPKDQQLSTLQKLSPEKQNKLLGEIKTRKSKAEPDFTANPKGEGLYQMAGKAGKTIGIPYSQVRAASQSGYKMVNPGEIKRYVKDTSVDPNINTLPKGSGTRVVGRNSAGQPILAPEEPAKPEGNPFSRLASSTGAVLGGAASGLHHAMVEGPQNPEEAKWDKRGLLKTYRLFIAPMQQEAEAAHREGVAADQAKTGYQRAAHGMRATGHALATLVPGLGPVASQAGELIGQQLGKGDIAGAAGTAAGNIALYEAPHVAPKAMRGLARLGGAGIERTAEALTDTGPRGLKKMAKETVEANRKAAEDAARQNETNAQKHREDTQNALHKTRGAELSHEQKINLAKAEADEANARRTREHAEKVKTVDAGNRAKTAEYEAEKSKASEVTKAAEQLETRRGQLARQVQEKSTRLLERIKRVKAEWKDDSQYIRSENARVASARAAGETAEYRPHGKLDVAYDQIRKATAGKTVPVESVADSVRKAEGKLKGSNENIKVFRDILSKAEDDAANLMEAGDVIGPEHPRYQQLRAIYEQEGIPVGEPPVPLGFNDLKGYYSELGEKLAGGNLPGDVYQALRSLQQDIGGMMQKMANDSGVGTKFSQTQNLYRKYMESFRESAGPNHSGSPIAQALDAADPAYAIKPLMAEETAQRVRNMLTEFDPPTEGQGGAGKLYDNFRATTREFDGLGKPMKIPEPPKPLKLEEPPEKPEPISPKPVPEAERTAPPVRPSEVTAERKTLGPEEISAKRTAHSQGAAQRLRDAGVRRALYIMASSTLGAIALAATGHPTWAFLSLAQAPMALLGSHALANLFDSPKFTERLGKITSRDLAAVSKLPPQEQAVFKQNLGQMVNMAKQRGVPVSPALRAFVVGSAVAPSTTKTMQQLRQETEQRRAAGLAGATPAASAAPGETMQEVPPEVSGLVPAEPTTSAPAAPGASAPTELPITTDESDTGY